MVSRFIVVSHTREGDVSLAFDSSTENLVCIGEATALPDLAVYAFDPSRDVFYRAPGDVMPEDLEHEVAVHFPHSLSASLNGTVFASSLGHAVLMQCVSHEAPLLSPLPALATLLENIGTVNSAILEADNGGLTLVRRAGDDITVHFSARPLAEFIELDPKTREIEFPDFDALEIILCGSEVSEGVPERMRRDRLSVVRTLQPADLLDHISFSEAALAQAGKIPQYALAFGVALAYREIQTIVERGQ